ncbi:DUF2264 domain-containing protein [Paenibacillus thermoaerophilus]|uniref:DUF2264 domain-containing protein n=1 Tax=Paenibacillus thermoaerophilus TaxID=1215385 RepID=A0ABW2V174_9BACL|nr:DUF2264 domain-containing protein [Paenibacillus thermoaerophilus]TMV18441.1 DUF2264 domain-containing protein [Paenibacillus thermoaerophilus]
MKRWDLPIARNPLRTKDDMRLAFAQLVDPLQPYYSAGSARLCLGHTGTSYSADVAGLEGFSRVLWGLVPLIAGGGESFAWERFAQGLRHGPDPAHPEYWGDAADYDQRLVEMAAFGLALALIPERIKAELTGGELERLHKWLDQITDRALWDCNWLFFRVMVQMGFKKAGLPHDRRKMERTLDELERFYLEDGWYADGAGGHSDYYVPFAFHYYGLLYAKLMEDDDPGRSRLYKDRAAAFAKSFIHWFAADGQGLPYGRSLTYRFSQSAFWSALAYAGVEPYPMGVIKGLILRNLRWWFAQPIFQPDGTLTIGYAYPNLVMAENYNSPCSPYWALKSFLPLALPDDHPFWTAEETELPQLERCVEQKAAHLVVCRPADSSHVLAFNTGHLSTNEHTHTSAKYEKFVYSTAFGFSVPRAEWGLAQGAFDSMLALSEGDHLYRVKRKCEETRIDGGVLYARWKPWADVEVETWLVPGIPWHVRVHRISTARRLDAADGGFALGIDAGRLDLRRGEDVRSAFASNALGTSGIACLYGDGRADLVYPNANTNLLHPRTVIPSVRASVAPGIAVIATAVCGMPGNGTSSARLEDAPRAVERDGELLVYAGDGDEPVLRVRLPQEHPDTRSGSSQPS